MSTHIGIAGAGIMGRSLAWRLCQQGYRVSLFDRDVAEPSSLSCTHSAAAFTAAGMLTPNTEWDAPQDTIILGQSALKRWPAFAATLGVDSVGRHVHLGNGGCWVVAHPNDQGSYEHAQRQVAHIDCISTVIDCHRRQLEQEQPTLAQNFTEAMFFPDESWVDPWQVMQCLQLRLQEHNVQCYWQAEIQDVKPRHIHTHDAQYDFDWVFDTRGLGARPQLHTLRGVRGETIELHAPEVNINALVRLMHPRYALYLVPRSDKRYVIGATQIESDDDGPISVRSALELLSAAYSLHPGFAEARILAQRTQCRPCLPDHRPRIETTHPGLTCINGLFRNGILLAPELAEQAIKHYLAMHSGSNTRTLDDSDSDGQVDSVCEDSGLTL